MGAAVMIRTLVAAGALGLAALSGAGAQQPALAPASPVTPPAAVAPTVPALPGAQAHALTAQDAETWLDGMMPSALRAAQVPGVVVVLVKDGKALVQKGYGLADWDKNIPVDADKTLFRPGSISKLFTWTAVMQQVEQGKLDLDADLNRYIDFKIPPRNGKALTLRHVMTHTTGFEESARDLITYGAVGPDLGKVLKQYVPPYVYDPGTTQGYSNYATALAGYIVERSSGMSFDDYVEAHIFKPLGMKDASFRQPLPAALAGQMSQGYEKISDGPKGFEIVSMAPAGSLSASGADMGKFMLAYLNQGAGLLKPETVKQMHGTITRGMPDLAGIGLGFYQQDINGHRSVGHGGDTVLFHSDLALFIDDGIGLYVSVNSPGKDGQGKWLRERLFRAFADRYLPDTRPAVKSEVDLATATAHARMMAGSYRNTRREDSTFLSLLQLLSPLKMQAIDQGRIAVELAGERGVFREIKPFLWQEEHGKRRLQALVENGKVVRWGLEPYVFAFVFEPVPFMASGTVLILFGLALLTALLTALIWPVAAVLRRRHRAPAPLPSVRWIRIAACLAVVAVALWGVTVTQLEELADLSALLTITQLVTIVAFTGGVLASVWHLRLALRGSPAIASRAMAATWLAAFLVLFVVGVYHHLLSINPWY